MRHHRWKDKTHPQGLWFAKLGEEFGEVAREVVEDIRGVPTVGAPTAKLIKELEHVEFIAKCWREDIMRGGAR